MELGLWLLFGLSVTSAAGTRAGRGASSGASAHKRTLGWGRGRAEGCSLLLGLTIPGGTWGKVGTEAGARTTPGALEVARGLGSLGQFFMKLGTFQKVCKLLKTVQKRLQSFGKVCKMLACFQPVQIACRLCRERK